MADSPAEAMRLDKFLWFARLARTRSAAQAIAADGHLRLNGRAVARAAALVRIGDVVTLPGPHGVRALRIESLPLRRGPAPEAAGLTTDLISNRIGSPLEINVSS